jgi:hypothetical protein
MPLSQLSADSDINLFHMDRKSLLCLSFSPLSVKIYASINEIMRNNKISFVYLNISEKEEKK